VVVVAVVAQVRPAATLRLVVELEESVYCIQSMVLQHIMLAVVAVAHTN
jgi:hypothetical protein